MGTLDKKGGQDKEVRVACQGLLLLMILGACVISCVVRSVNHL